MADSTMLDAALRYAAHGWAVFPVWPPTPEGGCTCGKPECQDPGKHPVGSLAPRGFLEATTDQETITRWWTAQPGANIGVAAGGSGLCIIDIDTHHGGNGFATWQALKEHHAIDDNTLTAITGGGGRHLFYAAPEDLHPRAKLGPGVDVKANGGYVVLPPSRHASGRTYAFDADRDPAHTQPAPLPPALRSLLERSSPTPPTPSSGQTSGAVIKQTSTSYLLDLQKAEAALGCLAQWRCDDYGEAGGWLQVGMALRELEERGLALWERWSRGSPKFREKVCAEKWETFTPGGNGAGRGLGSLYQWADDDTPTQWRQFLDTLPRSPSTGVATPSSSSTSTTSSEAEPERKPRYQSYLHRAVEAWEPRPPREWLLEGLLGAGDLVLLVGAPGIGKTYWCMDLGVCVAHGVPFLDLATTGSPVLLVDEESGNRRLLERLEQVMRGRGLPPGSDIPLSYITMAGFSFLQDPTWFVELELAIQATGARLVLMDALPDLMLGGDENLVRDTQPVCRGLKGVCEVTGATVVVIHHTNKAGGFRGSTAIPGAVDLALQLTRKDKSRPVKVETVKERDIAPMALHCRMAWDDLTQSVKFDRAETPEQDREQYQEPDQVKLDRGERYVLRYLASQPRGALKREIEQAADSCTSGTASNAIYDLADRRLIERLDSGGSGKSAVYGLTEAGRELMEDLSLSTTPRSHL
jgi:hypothetical protein